MYLKAIAIKKSELIIDNNNHELIEGYSIFKGAQLNP